MKAIGQKLRSQRGDSIAEVLVAVLIAAVALVMLATMLSTSGNLIRISRGHLEDYYEANNVLSDPPSDAGTAGTVTLSAALTDAAGASVDVTYYINDTLSSDPVVAYRIAD